MNTRIALSAVSIFAALTLMGGATYAAFTSEASSNNNTFNAGTLTLTVTPQGGTASSPTFTVSGIAPGESISKYIILANTGSVASTTTKLVDIVHSTTTAPEDLGDKLNLEIIDDLDHNGVADVGEPIRGSAPITSPAWANIDLGFGIAGGSDHAIVARVTLDPTTSNSYQGKNSTFNLNFQTSQ